MIKKLIDWLTDDSVVIKKAPQLSNQYFKQDEAPKQLRDGDAWEQEKTGHMFIWSDKKSEWEFVPPVGMIPQVERDEEGRWVR